MIVAAFGRRSHEAIVTVAVRLAVSIVTRIFQLPFTLFSVITFIIVTASNFAVTVLPSDSLSGRDSRMRTLCH